MRLDLTVYRGLGEVPDDFGPSVVTIGVFDGVHLGHQELIRTVIELARENGAVPIVATFDRHPLAVVAPDMSPASLTTLPQRARRMAALGIEAMVVMTFDDVFRHLSPEEFVTQVLVEDLHAVHTVVGANFTFGHERSGTIETLKELGRKNDFGVTVVDLQTIGGSRVVSSTLIRRAVQAGDVERAADEMGHPHSIVGTVERGAGRGAGLGFPTANLRVPAKILLPKIGVYAGWLVRDDERLPAAINVGVNPTFEERVDPIVEVHVIDFEDDLYAEVVEVEFVSRLRDEQRFESADALVTQMSVDVARAREILGLKPAID